MQHLCQREALEESTAIQKDIQNDDESKEKDNLINPSSRFELAVIEAGDNASLSSHYYCFVKTFFFFFSFLH